MIDRSQLLIREMQATDLAFAASCTSGEGWVSENDATLEGFYLNNPHGCLLAEINEQPVGICIATSYGKSGFIGELIVRPQARGKGVGTTLLNQAIRLLRDSNAETIYLDGVLKAVDLYGRNGFRKVCRSWRFSGYTAGSARPHTRRMVAGDMDQVASLDKASFGEDRRFFLQRRLELFPELSYVIVEGESIGGYILGRGGEGWVSAGPWVVTEACGNPVELLQAFATEAHGRPISVGILGLNSPACQLMQSLGFEPRIDSPWRMALGPASNLGTSPLCYAVGSAAKG